MRARPEAWTGLSGDDGSGRSGQRDPDYGERRGREALINRTSRRRETKNGIPDTRRTLSQGLALPDGRPTGPRSGVLSPWLFLSLNLCQALLPPPLETASSLSAPHTQRISTDWRSRTGAGVLLRQANGDSDGDEDRPSASPPRVPRHYRLPRPEGVNHHVPQEPIPSVWNRCTRRTAQRRSAETDSNSRHAVEAEMESGACVRGLNDAQKSECVCGMRWGAATNPSSVPPH